MVRVNGFDSAIVGVTEGFPHRLAYSSQRIIDILCEKNCWTWEDALDFAEYNIFSAYVGEEGPIFIDTLDENESLEELIESYE